MNKYFKKRFFLIIFLIGVIAASNYYSTYINIFTDGLFKTYYYESESGNFQFTAMPSKGRGIDTMKRQYQKFLQENDDLKEEKIYRTFKINVFKFWN